ncbi:MAG: pirin family protein [Pseudomonadota bacterium]
MQSSYIRKAEERGRVNFGWLDSRHSFSFGNYFDPAHMGYSVLRVINDDHVAPGKGFDPHGHRDMEIISVVLEGALEHKDSTGNAYRVEPGEVQVMSAGTGIQHSEYNASAQDTVHFLQIWITPDKAGYEPEYRQARFDEDTPLALLVSPDGVDGSLKINQDARISRVQLSAGDELTLKSVSTNRKQYFHCYQGAGEFLHTENTVTVQVGDGVGTDNQQFELKAGADGLAGLWFDLPGDSLH